jgi:hypothetical protein
MRNIPGKNWTKYEEKLSAMRKFHPWVVNRANTEGAPVGAPPRRPLMTVFVVLKDDPDAQPAAN